MGSILLTSQLKDSLPSQPHIHNTQVVLHLYYPEGISQSVSLSIRWRFYSLLFPAQFLFLFPLTVCINSSDEVIPQALLAGPFIIYTIYFRGEVMACRQIYLSEKWAPLCRSSPEQKRRAGVLRCHTNLVHEVCNTVLFGRGASFVSDFIKLIYNNLLRAQSSGARAAFPEPSATLKAASE